MLEVAVVVLMFLGIAMAMRMDVSPRTRAVAQPTPDAVPAATEAQDITPARAA